LSAELTKTLLQTVSLEILPTGLVRIIQFN